MERTVLFRLSLILVVFHWIPHSLLFLIFVCDCFGGKLRIIYYLRTNNEVSDYKALLTNIRAMAHSMVVIGHALNLKNNCISLVFQTHVFMSHKPTCILSISGQFEHNMDSIILRSFSICCVYCSRRFKFYRYSDTPFYDN